MLKLCHLVDCDFLYCSLKLLVAVIRIAVAAFENHNFPCLLEGYRHPVFPLLPAFSLFFSPLFYLWYLNLDSLFSGGEVPFLYLMHGTVCQKQPPRTRSRGVHGSSRGLQNAPKTSSKKGSRAVVTIYDASSLFFIHKELGEKYV